MSKRPKSFICSRCRSVIYVLSNDIKCRCGARYIVMPNDPAMFDPRQSHTSDPRLAHGDAGKQERLDALRKLGRKQ
jgi:DNA-directed RNA polymerase subunit RPC12/RpoP